MTETGSETQAAYYPIRVVAAETGVNAITLRAWERRYGLITPKRTAKGHRLYTDQDIKLIRQVVSLLDRGIPISQAQAMLANGDASIEVIESTRNEAPSQWQHYRDQLHEAVKEFDDVKLGKTFEEVAQFFPVEVAIRFLFMPFYEQLKSTSTFALGAARLNFYTAFLQARLAWRISDREISSDEKRILVVNSTMDAEVQLLLVAILLQQLNLGITRISGLIAPADITELVRECAKWPAILVQIESQPSDNRISQLQSIAAETGCPVFVTGQQGAFDSRLRQAGLIPLGQDPQKAALNIRDMVQGLQ